MPEIIFSRISFTLSLREKSPNTEFFLFRICLYPDWIRRDTPYLSVFSPNTGKYGPEKSRIWTFFTHCMCTWIYNLLFPLKKSSRLQVFFLWKAALKTPAPKYLFNKLAAQALLEKRLPPGCFPVKFIILFNSLQTTTGWLLLMIHIFTQTTSFFIVI